MDIQKNITEMACSFFMIQDNRIAIAEINLFHKEMMQDYLEDVDIDKEKIQQVFNNTEKIYFFNRLNVPEKMRNHGIGARLLKEVLDFIASQNAMLINTVNSYGDLSQEELIKWYEKNGMCVGNKQGLLFFHTELAPKNTLKKKMK